MDLAQKNFFYDYPSQKRNYEEVRADVKHKYKKAAKKEAKRLAKIEENKNAFFEQDEKPKQIYEQPIQEETEPATHDSSDSPSKAKKQNKRYEEFDQEIGVLSGNVEVINRKGRVSISISRTSLEDREFSRPR